MPQINFIHTADLHLDTPFKGLSNINNELASRLKDATFKSFQRIINLCISERVDFLLVAGDIFDSEAKSLAAQLFFVEELKRLANAGIPAYIITGNHDPMVSWIPELTMPELVHRFGSSQVECVSFIKNNQPAADIYGISYLNKSVTKNLAVTFQKKVSPAPVSIALLHGTVENSGANKVYAPFGLNDVRSSGFDYWALGHVHKRQIMSESFPTVVYPGNPQGRDFGETGQRGCYKVTVGDNNAPQLQFIPTQSIRFEELVIDLTGIDTINVLGECIDKAISKLTDFDNKTSYMLRIRLEGRTTLHKLLSKPGEILNILNMLNEGQLHQENFNWIDRIDLRTFPAIDLNEIKNGNDFTADLLKEFESLLVHNDIAIDVFHELDNEFNSQQAQRELEPLTPEEKEEIIMKAQWMLIDQLLKD